MIDQTETGSAMTETLPDLDALMDESTAPLLRAYEATNQRRSALQTELAEINGKMTRLEKVLKLIAPQALPDEKKPAGRPRTTGGSDLRKPPSDEVVTFVEHAIRGFLATHEEITVPEVKELVPGRSNDTIRSAIAVLRERNVLRLAGKGGSRGMTNLYRLTNAATGAAENGNG